MIVPTNSVKRLWLWTDGRTWRKYKAEYRLRAPNHDNWRTLQPLEMDTVLARAPVGTLERSNMERSN